MERQSEKRDGLVVPAGRENQARATEGMTEITIDHTGGTVQDLGTELRRGDRDRGVTSDDETMNTHQGGPVVGAIHRNLGEKTATGIKEKTGEDKVEMFIAPNLNQKSGRNATFNCSLAGVPCILSTGMSSRLTLHIHGKHSGEYRTGSAQQDLYLNSTILHKTVQPSEGRPPDILRLHHELFLIPTQKKLKVSEDRISHPTTTPPTPSNPNLTTLHDRNSEPRATPKNEPIKQIQHLPIRGQRTTIPS